MKLQQNFSVLHLGNRVRIYPIKILLAASGFVLLIHLFYSQHSRQIAVKTVKELKVDKEKILALSKLYVKDLSDRLLNVKDGPVAYPDTSYDMKKALAVLINDLNDRMERMSDKIEYLESKIRSGGNQSEIALRKAKNDPTAVDAVDLLNNKQDVCPFPDFQDWPYCESKMGWMREMWKSDPCYAEWGVDGTDCSFLVFLSEQEHWCPTFPWRVNKTAHEEHEDFFLAEVRSDFESLYEQMGDAMHFEWIKSRVWRMSERWIEAGKALRKKFESAKRKKKKVLFHMGLLSEDVGWKIAENAFSGGPLGELVQWSDVISAVYILGHEITLTKTVSDLERIYHPYLNSASSSCPLKSRPFDIVYTDITGLKMLKKVAVKKLHLLQCNVRVLDSFGTEPEFNHPNYASKKSHKTSWGKWNLNPKQFNTMFPHSPDNTFLGFVVEEHMNDTNIHQLKKENISLVYGKRDLFWKDKRDYISALHDVIEVHSTVDNKSDLQHVPSFVHNHGVLPGIELHKLLRKAKIFIGLGFPYEGPAPLEAIANGAVFLNPVFKKPKNSINTPFFAGKPTLRKLTSQHPYAEMYIGPPYVRSVNMEDLASLKKLVTEILTSNEELKPYMPYEFKCAGMLERLSLYLDKQDFCSGNVKPVWPPQSALQIKITDDKQSCSEICHSNGLVCEPAFFPLLNRKSKFAELNINCTQFVSTVPQTEIDYPAYLHDKCFLQSDTKLFSCAGRYTAMNRICPCRDYLPGQVALCKDCLDL